MKYLMLVISILYSASIFAYDYSNSTIKKHNAYGHGVHKDQYGRAVTIQPKNNSYSNPLLKIQENKYGYRQHSDQFGRPVTIKAYGVK